MSVEFHVALRSSLPSLDGGWSFQVGPVAITRIEGKDDQLYRHARELVPDVADLLVTGSNGGGAVINEGLAHLIAEALGGAVIYEDGPEIIATFDAPATPPTGPELRARIERYLTDESARDEEEKRRARAEWEALVAADPQVKKDSDWSDL
jgi:hypothetical protein